MGKVIALVFINALQLVIIHLGFQVTPQEISMDVRSGDHGGHSTGPLGSVHQQTN
jgi:hypothetical protein